MDLLPDELLASPTSAPTCAARSSRWPPTRAWRSTSCWPTTCRRRSSPISSGLQQILRNLLSNAFKFTAPGWRDAARSRARADDAITFAVTDTGIGIAEDKLAVIFEAFQQADGTTSRTYGGTGLGLSISRELALALGGEISVSSALGVGQHVHPHAPARCGRQSSGGGGRDANPRRAPRQRRRPPLPARAADDDAARGHRP